MISFSNAAVSTGTHMEDYPRYPHYLRLFTKNSEEMLFCLDDDQYIHDK